MVSRYLGPLIFLLCVGALAQDAPTKAQIPGPTNDKGRKHMETAVEWLYQRNRSAALSEYKKAFESDPGCMQCAVKGMQLGLQLEDTKATVAIADEVIKSQAPEQYVRFADFSKATALLHEAESRNKQDLYAQAEAVYAGWLASHAEDADFLLSDGFALAHLGKDDAAKANFEKFLKVAKADDVHRVRVERILEHPELARARMAPAFSGQDIHGSEVSLDQFEGKVVLLDFWATWCGPCNEELPHITKIAQEYTGQPLVVISISWDKDAQKWQDFVAKHDMNWIQIRDADHSITNKFGIDAIPHYFTIDTDGVLQKEQLGGGSGIDGKLKKMVAEAVKHQQQVAEAPKAEN